MSHEEAREAKILKGRSKMLVVLLLVIAAVGACGFARWPSRGWKERLEEDLQGMLGVPVTIDSFSVGLFRASVAQGIKVQNSESFSNMGNLVECERAVLEQRVLPRLMGKLDVTDLRLTGLHLRVGRLLQGGWNIGSIKIRTSSKGEGLPQRVKWNLDSLSLDQARASLVTQEGSSNTMFANVMGSWSGITRSRPSNLEISSESSYGQFRLAGTVDKRNGYELRIEETGAFDFGKYLASLGEEINVQALPISGSGTAKMEGKISGALASLTVQGKIVLDEVELAVMDVFKKPAGLQAEISYEMGLEQGVFLLKEFRIRDLLSGWKASGKVDPAGDVKADLAIESDNSDLRHVKRYFPGLEKRDVNGRLTSSGHLTVSGDKVAFDGRLQGEALNIDKVHVDQLDAQVASENRQMELKTVSAEMYEGKLELSGRLSLEETDRGFELAFRMDGIDIGELAGDFSPDVEGALEGTLKGEMHLSSDSETPEDFLSVSSMDGQASLAVEDAKLSGLSPVQEVLKLAGEKKGSDMAFEKAEADFSLNNGNLATDRMELVSKPISLTGSGNMDAAQNLDYRLTISLSPELMANLPKLRPSDAFHVDEKGYGIFQFGLSGTFSEPMLNIPSDLLMEFFRLRRPKNEKLPPLPAVPDVPIPTGGPAQGKG